MSPTRVPRTLILSDLHLGRPDAAGRADAFEPLLADFDRVIVNGDVAELHHAAFQADARLELDRFSEICHTRGTRLDLLAGNHDPFVSELRALTLADGAIYITHGDAFHPAVAPWSPRAAVMRRAFDQAIAGSPADAPEDEVRFNAAREASLAEWRALGDGAHISTLAGMAFRPARIATVLRYWASFPMLSAEWAARFSPRAGTVIVGHSHRAFHRKLLGRHIVNTGAYSFPGRPHAVVVEGSTVRMHAVIRRGHMFALAPDARAAWPIAFHDAAAASVRGDQREASTCVMNDAAAASAARSIEVR
jgi:predicted phosphodiesterase